MNSFNRRPRFTLHYKWTLPRKQWELTFRDITVDPFTTALELESKQPHDVETTALNIAETLPGPIYAAEFFLWFRSIHFMVSALLLSAANGWVVLSSAAHSDGFLSDGSPTMWVLIHAPWGRFTVTVMHGVALHVAKSLWLQYSRALSSITFHNASILMFPSQRMFCHYGSQPNSLAERIMSSKKPAGKKEKVLRGSAWKQDCILNFLPLAVIWTPRCCTYRHAHACAHFSHQPSCFGPLQKNEENPAVLAASWKPVRSRPGIANILQA